MKTSGRARGKARFGIGRKDCVVIAVIVVLFASSMGVRAYTNPVPNPGHGGDSIAVSVGGYEKTLQQAIDSDFFTNCYRKQEAQTTNDYEIMCGTNEVATGGGIYLLGAAEKTFDSPYGSFPITYAGGIVVDGAKPIGWHCRNYSPTTGDYCYVVCCK